MKKVHLIEYLVGRGIARSTAMEVIDEAIDIIADKLSSGETVTLRGLGTFKVKTVAPKVARNISKGTLVMVPAHKSVKLIPSLRIKNTLKKLS